MMPMQKEISVSNVCLTSNNSRAAIPNGNVGIANFETADAVSETSVDKSEKSDGLVMTNQRIGLYQLLLPQVA